MKFAQQFQLASGAQITSQLQSVVFVRAEVCTGASLLQMIAIDRYFEHSSFLESFPVRDDTLQTWHLISLWFLKSENNLT